MPPHFKQMNETIENIGPPDEMRSWEAARRIESWAGEIRVNRLRLAAIIVFYVRLLIDMYVNRQNQALGRCHRCGLGRWCLRGRCNRV